MVYEVQNLLVISENSVRYEKSQLANCLEKLGSIFLKPFLVDIHLEDRHNLDSYIFDIFHLTPGEREGVYEAVIHLVETRLKKAGSV